VAIAGPVKVDLPHVLGRSHPDRRIHLAEQRLEFGHEIVYVLSDRLVVCAETDVNHHFIGCSLDAHCEHLRADQALRRLKREEESVVLPIQSRSSYGTSPNTRVSARIVHKTYPVMPPSGRTFIGDGSAR
jgi:hypothetical protein